MERERCSYRNPTLVVSVGSLPVRTKHRRWRDSRRSSLVPITLLSHKFISSNELKMIWISTWAFLHILFFKGFWEKNEYMTYYVSLWRFKHNLILLISPSPIVFHHLPACPVPFHSDSPLCSLCVVCVLSVPTSTSNPLFLSVVRFLVSWSIPTHTQPTYMLTNITI